MMSCTLQEDEGGRPKVTVRSPEAIFNYQMPKKMRMRIDNGNDIYKRK